MKSKVSLISIGYLSVFDQNMITLHVWGEFESKEAAINKVNQVTQNSLTKEQKDLLEHQGCVTTGSSEQHQQHWFILYPDEQKQWIKTLVRELL